MTVVTEGDNGDYVITCLR